MLSFNSAGMQIRVRLTGEKGVARWGKCSSPRLNCRPRQGVQKIYCLGKPLSLSSSPRRGQNDERKHYSRGFLGAAILWYQFSVEIHSWKGFERSSDASPRVSNGPKKWEASTTFSSSDSPTSSSTHNFGQTPTHKSWSPKSFSWEGVIPLSKTLRKMKPFIYPQMPIILKGWFCTAVAVVAVFLFVPEIGGFSNLLAKGDLSSLTKKAVKVLSLVAARSVAQFWQQALLWEAALNITYAVRVFVYENVLNREMGYFEGQGGAAAGDIAYRLTAEAEDAGGTVYALLHMLVPSLLQLAAMATRMVMLSPLLSIATISMTGDKKSTVIIFAGISLTIGLQVVPVMSVAIAILGERLRQLAKKGKASVASISAYLNEVLPSMFVVKAHAAEAFEQRRFERLALADCYACLGKKRMKAFIPEVITAVYAATAVVLFGVGTWAISQGSFDGAGMVSFMTSLVLLIEPIQVMGRAYNELKQGEPAIERLFELTSVSPEVLEEVAITNLTRVLGEVELCNVAFRYRDTSPWVLNDISLRVHAGETVALVGPSGGGKTTLTKLLLRLYDPVCGSVRIDGHDISELSLKSLRQHVAIVPQETTLFTGTVAENIAYGDMNEKLDMREIEQAARLANADGFIKKLPDGYNTHLGDRASCLSGGQRQRLAIARAIYQKASILILDEATSALDNKSEKLVREALERLTVGRTVFVIAHRLETVQHADRILLLDGGRLVEEGTHYSLLKQGGQYAALYTRQEFVNIAGESL